MDCQAMSIKTQHQKQLQDRENIIDRYKKQLSESLKREKDLEHKLVQMEMDWQENCEDIQSKHYLEHEQLIQELTAAREKVNAELMETKARLQEVTVLLQCVTKERDQALQGCIPRTGSLASEELAALQQHNYRLQAVVSEMRKQMEELSRTTPPLQHRHSENNENKKMNVPKTEDVKQLETNILNVKEKPQKSACVCSCGRVCSVHSSVAQLRSRLKQAASCIAHLNRDRQQLIELCNRLRAQVCAAPPLGQRNGNPVKHRAHQSTDGLKSEENCQKGLSESVDQSSPQNCSRVPHKPSEKPLPSLSALWALLDQRPLQDHNETPPQISLGLGAGGAEMKVCGVASHILRKSTAKPPQKRGQLRNTGKVSQSARIRNYNIKD